MNEEMLATLKRIADEMENKRRTETTYYEEDYHNQNGWNDCLDEIQKHLRDGAGLTKGKE